MVMGNLLFTWSFKKMGKSSAKDMDFPTIPCGFCGIYMDLRLLRVSPVALYVFSKQVQVQLQVNP
jgi:hypothetical protein